MDTVHGLVVRGHRIGRDHLLGDAVTPAADFAALVQRMVDEACRSAFPAAPGDALPIALYERIVGQAEAALIALMLERNHGNQTWTARELGINRNTLRTLMRKHGIAPELEPLTARGGHFTAQPPSYA